ncbi:hypothetical protein HK097_001283 [Rhizophlyctis rosea]|uniref:Pumilio n=1 Tax=Rhizophlyctis rosea TaxID=64517 RepID=A0AAD5X7G3_9FUNG|nr:hypothetical protein HK097_001283 [Rhizophlyctis rosea]
MGTPPLPETFLFEDDGPSYGRRFLQNISADEEELRSFMARRDAEANSAGPYPSPPNVGGLAGDPGFLRGSGPMRKPSHSQLKQQFEGAELPEDLLEAVALGGQTDFQMSAAKICKYFVQGFCSRADRCNFSHVLPRPMMGPYFANQGIGYQGLNMANPMAYNLISQMSMLAPYPYGPGLGYNPAFGYSQKAGLTAQKQKRPSISDEGRFATIVLEDVAGQIYPLCKDQHGCRFLQKQIESQDPTKIQTIFNEIYGHFIELMTDPFGNYLCQKFLEFCNDEQRTMLIEAVAPELVTISLNMHGTRAAQKLIEHLSTKQQIRVLVRALSSSVVVLIKDLNGNHVIQKCLHRLPPEHNQFVYDAVTTFVVEVATHRHGCCVLQRCIDHASPRQQAQLVDEIIYHALTLVQDPFGNYVVQYVLDLPDVRFCNATIQRFLGNIANLSTQKFSSNVIEKCIRVAQIDTRRALVNEILNKNQLNKLLGDCYGNYVVQTALDFADPMQRKQLVECIRPLLPAIRNTPYGKRLNSKLHREFTHDLDMLYYPGFPSLAGLNPGLNPALNPLYM